MPIVTLQDGIRFPVEAGETILDAAGRAGVNIGYACRTGRCSTCKCRTVSGTTRALHPELGLAQGDVEEGWLLSCVRTVDADVELVADEIIRYSLPAKQLLPCRIDALTTLAPDVLEVRLRLPPSAKFASLPGQYIDIIGPKGVRRSYSLASGGASHSLCLHVRHVPGGVLSSYWFGEAKVGDLLRLSGPMGTFFLRDVADRRLVFLATGTGIAPVTAMLEGLAQPGIAQPRDITVIWGGRHVSDLYADLSRFDQPFNYWPVLSRPDPNWTGRFGYVQDSLVAAGYDLGETVVYACGSDSMIRSAKLVLIGAGLDPHAFHSDAFVCSATI
jgi:CDP-4-dehydro-6-deoxyglucose reductase